MTLMMNYVVNKMSKKEKILDTNYLISLGMKEALIAKLDDEQIENILSYAMEHSKSENLLNSLIKLASMESRDKKGAAFLACNDIATISQLKNMRAEQIEVVIDDLYHHNDHQIAIKAVKQYIILNQQEKLYYESGGVNGEYFVDPKSPGDEDFA